MKVLLLERCSDLSYMIENIISETCLNAEIVVVKSVNNFYSRLADGKFGLIIMDLDVEEKTMLRLKNCINRYNRDVPVIVTTLFEEIFFPVSYFKFGAYGYLNKQFSADQMVQAIHAALNRKRYIDERLIQGLIKYASGEMHPLPFQRLTNKGLLIVQEILKGKTMREVVNLTGMSRTAVQKIVKQTFGKLGIEEGNISGLVSVVRKYDML